jgi:hypothetical protein
VGKRGILGVYVQGWVARALEAGIGCSIYLKKTHVNTLKLVPIETLKKFAIDLS